MARKLREAPNLGVKNRRLKAKPVLCTKVKPVVAKVRGSSEPEDPHDWREQYQGRHRAARGHSGQSALALGDDLIALNYRTHSL